MDDIIEMLANQIAKKYLDIDISGDLNPYVDPTERISLIKLKASLEKAIDVGMGLGKSKEERV